MAPAERVKGLNFLQCLLKPNEIKRFEIAIAAVRQRQRVNVDTTGDNAETSHPPGNDADLNVLSPVLRYADVYTCNI